MGVVYRALDLKLNREVALKVLPPELVADPDRKRRFIQEAQAAAGLDHPNIAVIHEIDEVDGVSFIAMELIRGEPLRDILQRERLPVSRVLALATEVGEGLSRAHDKGIVHRDVEPANVMVTEQGHPKIIDFGLAKLVDVLVVEDDEGVTAVRGDTDPGLVMGTVSYMSPEQAKGADVDARSDIFTFGIVLYEMLSGERPFRGANGAEVLSAILKDPAPRLPPLETEVSDELQRIVDRCLAKDPAARYQTMSELVAELSAVRRRLESGAVAVSRGNVSRTTWLLGAVTCVAVLVGLLVVMGERDVGLPEIERTIQLSHDPGLEVYPAISPDGKMIAYAAGPVGDMHVYVQQIEGGRRIAVTETPGNYIWPQWSPDGSRIAFEVVKAPSYEIHVVPSLGGAARLVFEASDNEISGFAWAPEGERLAISANLEIFIQSLVDDSRETLTTIPDEAFPLSWSPDGTKIAFSMWNAAYVARQGPMANVAPAGLYVIPADGVELVTLIEGEGTSLNQSPVWTPSGDALFFVSNSGGSRDIYQVRLSPSGAPAAAPLRLTTGLGVHTISLSSDGRRLAYSTIASRQNVWSLPMPDDEPISSDGASPVTRGSQMIEGMDISSDGEWIIFDSNRAGNQDIYKMRLDGGEPVALTSDPADDFQPMWSPDGEEVVFYSLRSGNRREVYVMSADGGSVRPLTDQGGIFPDWSPDGQEIVFFSPRAGISADIYVSSRLGEIHGEAPRRLTTEGGLLPKWSPDDTRIAFWEPVSPGTDFVSVVSLQSGEVERLVRLGNIDSVHVAWSEDGRTIYYKAQQSDGAESLWSAPASGGEPQELVHFDDPARPSMRREFTHDGERFYFTLTEHESDIWMMELIQ